MSRQLQRLAIPPWLLAIGVATFIAGRLFDAWRHGAHDEFESGGDQIQAHWLVWLGTLVIAVAAAQGVRDRRSGGYALTIAGALGYAAVAAWHFYEHTERREVDLTHLLLVVANVVVLAGAIWIVIDSQRVLGGSTNPSTPRGGSP